MLHNFPLTAAPGWVNVVLIVLLGITVPLVGMRARPLITILLAVGLGVAFTVGVQLAFNSGTIVTVRVSARRADPGDGGHAHGPAGDRGVRADPDA